MGQTARIERPLFHREGSASTRDSPAPSAPILLSLSNLARRDSMGGADLRWCRRRGADDFPTEVCSDKRMDENNTSGQEHSNDEIVNSHRDCLARRDCKVDVESIANSFLRLCA